MPEPATPSRPDWLPTNGVRAVPCARWFDAVCVDAFDAVPAIRRMGHRSGPAIEDQAEDLVTWLVPVGAADGWRLAGVRVLGRGQEIRVPPPGWRGAIQWLVEPPAVGDCLTSPLLLHDALRSRHG
ncbi:hypothetical protein [Streptomyces sp. B6B3]|uniref:hypothetical protein n=1 Tax=Streptomyces sp. B6B3 TaxID=3153570 RepID=UPI00325F62A6